MPTYLFSDPQTGQIKEVYQKMDEIHDYQENGVKFNRIFTTAEVSMDAKWDALNSKDFVAKTASHKGTYGDLLDKSKELSLKREQIMGHDPIKKQAYENFAKARKGKRHPDQNKEILRERLDKRGVILED